MGAKIKLQRKGTKNRPFYRVVVQHGTSTLGGTVVAVLGQYDPLAKPTLFQVDPEKTKGWLSKGALPTDKVKILLGKAGIIPPVDLASLPKRKSKAEQKAALEEAKKEAPKKEEPKPEEKKEG